MFCGLQNAEGLFTEDFLQNIDDKWNFCNIQIVVLPP